MGEVGILPLDVSQHQQFVGGLFARDAAQWVVSAGSVLVGSFLKPCKLLASIKSKEEFSDK